MEMSDNTVTVAELTSEKLVSLKGKLSKSLAETGLLKEAIAKEENRLKEKARRDNEKWWKDLSKSLEQFLIHEYGPTYKNTVSKEMILSAVKEYLHHQDQPLEVGTRSTEFEA